MPGIITSSSIEVRALPIRDRERLLAARRAQHGAAERREAARDEIEVGGLVVDREHRAEALGRRRGRVGSPGADGQRRILRKEASQHRAQLGRRIRLGHEVITAGVDRALTVLLHRESGDGDDRDARGPRLFAQQARDGPPVDAREQQVHEDRVGTLGARDVEAALAIHGDQRLMTRGANDALRDVEVVGLVLDDEHPSHAHPCDGHDRAAVPARLPSGRAAARTRTGRVNRNVLPAPTVLSTQMRPPCSAMSRFEMARPRPVPP